MTMTQTNTLDITCGEVVDRHPVLGPLHRRYPGAASPYEMINLYLVGHGIAMRPEHKYITTVLNQDKRALLVHLAGEGRNGQRLQTMDGYVYNDNSEFGYDPFAATLTYENRPISDIAVQHLWRSPYFKSYYVRNLSTWDGPVITTDENNGHCPGGCTFCPNEEISHKALIDTPAYLDMIMRELQVDGLDTVSELGIVTSLFRTEPVAIDYLLGFIDAAAQRKFAGVVNYMSCQLSDRHSMDTLASAARQNGIQMMHLHTVEKYYHRRAAMGPMKGKRTLEELRPILEEAVTVFGRQWVGYNYVLGLESVDDFARGLDYLYPTGAIPHVNVFIPFATDYNPKLTKVRRDISGFIPTPEFTNNRIDYLVRCRDVYLRRYAAAPWYYTMNNCGKYFQYPPDKRHLHAHPVRFGTINMQALHEFELWERDTPLTGDAFEAEKEHRMDALQEAMFLNYAETRQPLLHIHREPAAL